MSSTQKSSATTKATIAKQIVGSVTTAVTTTDATAADRIQSLSLMNQARGSRLARTAASLAAQYGATSAAATAAQAAVTANQSTVSRIQVLHQQVTTATPVVAANGWALHGRVYDSNLQAVAGHTVFLVDNQKTYQESYGFAYTDSTGYFLINVADTASPPVGENIAPAAESTETPSQSTTPASGAATPLFVQIANTSGKPVYLSATTFQAAVGKATYQNITLAAGEPVLGEPTAAIRKTAFPPQK
jgi:hypothetical protein